MSLPFTSENFKTSLLEHMPTVLDWWDDPRDPNSIGKSSSIPIKLVCKNNHKFESKPCNFSNKRIVCHECKSIGFNYPELIELLVNKSDKYLSTMSHKVIEWFCPKGHTYMLRVSKAIGRGDRCPYCSNHKVLSGFNDLKSQKPEVASLLTDQSIADSVHVYSNKTYSFTCPEGHVWLSSLSNVSQGRRCNVCALNKTSIIEKFLSTELSKNFTITHINPEDYIKINNKKVSIDMLISVDSLRIIVEFDGAYWHTIRVDQDTKKTNNILEEGFLVVRFRESTNYFTLPLLDIESDNLLQIPVDINYYNQKYEEYLPEVIDNILVPWVRNHQEQLGKP